MEKQDVKSSNILSIGYDEDQRTLEVEFVGGKIYQYFNVEQERFDELVKADSIGSYFSKNIRKSYEFKQCVVDKSFQLKKIATELNNNN